MKTLGYYNGAIDELEKVKVPMLDRGCYFGDGVYDAAFSKNGKIFAFDDHIDRFFNSAGLLHINLSYTKDEVKKLLLELLEKMDDDEQFVYWQLTRGTALRAHDFDENMKSNLWVMIKPGAIKDVKKKLKLMTVEDTRFLHCNIKTLNLIPNVLGAQTAKVNGCDETIFHRQGKVTECAHSNVSILKNGVLITHPTDHLILPGISRNHMLALCKRNGIPVDETDYTLKDAFEADEIIITSSGFLCASASELDGRPVGGKDYGLFAKIQKLMLEEYKEQTGI